MNQVLNPRRDSPAKLRRERWREAKRFQRRVQAALRGQCVTFSEWLVLTMIAELSLEHGEDVSQNAVAERTGLTRVTAGYWTRVLEHKGWVDRGENANPRAWGVILTESGARVLARCDERLELLPDI